MSVDLARWNETLRLLGVAPTQTLTAVGDDLLSRYREPHRHYHTLAHLDDCLTQAQQVRAQCQHAGEVEFALWFHDAIYDTRKSDNEQRCADWARQSALAAGVNAAVAGRIHALILSTRHAASPDSPDAALLIDIDLSILGADAARFDAYEAEIRSEYHWVPMFLFNLKRKQILREFLARPQIYSSPEYQHRLEARARANLTRSIGR